MDLKESTKMALYNQLKVFKGRLDNYPESTTVKDFKMIGLKVEELDKEKALEELKDQQILQVDGNGLVTGLDVEAFQSSYQVQDLTFTGVIDGLKQKELAYDFSKWLAEEKNVVKNVKLDPSTGANQLYRFDVDTKTWIQDGESFSMELLYDTAPEKHSKHLEQETLQKLKRINPLTMEEMGLPEETVAVGNGKLDITQLINNGDDLSGNPDCLSPIHKTDYALKRLPVPLETGATPTKWLRFLEDVTKSEKDRKKLQEYIGYCLLKDTCKHEKALMLLGPTNSGKGVFLDVIRALFGGDNVAQETLQDLADTNWATANLKGNLININHDLNADGIYNTGKVKQLISGNPLTVEQKHKQPYDYTPNQKHLFSANQSPERDGESDAFYGRFEVVEFPYSIPDEDQDKQLVDKLTTDEELKGVLYWALNGLRRLENQGMFTSQQSPAEVKRLWREYGGSVDKFISKFIETRTKIYNELKESGLSDKKTAEEIEEMDLKVSIDHLYDQYQKFTTITGNSVKTKKEFSQKIRDIPQATDKRVGTSRGVGNVRLVEDYQDKLTDLKDNLEGLPAE